MTKMMSAAAAAYLRYSEGFMTCVDIKVRAPTQSWTSRSEVVPPSQMTVGWFLLSEFERKHESRG